MAKARLRSPAKAGSKNGGVMPGHHQLKLVAKAGEARLKPAQQNLVVSAGMAQSPSGDGKSCCISPFL